MVIWLCLYFLRLVIIFLSVAPIEVMVPGDCCFYVYCVMFISTKKITNGPSIKYPRGKGKGGSKSIQTLIQEGLYFDWSKYAHGISFSRFLFCFK